MGGRHAWARGAKGGVSLSRPNAPRQRPVPLSSHLAWTRERWWPMADAPQHCYGAAITHRGQHVRAAPIRSTPCAPAAAGHFCSGGARVACNEGFYSATRNAYHRGTCTRCPANSAGPEGA